MKKHFFKLVYMFVAGFFCIFLVNDAHGGSFENERFSSVHAGFFYPNGVDLAGYTAEFKLRNRLYGYYTLGIPSLAAVGVCFYEDYRDTGVVATIGIGIGSVLYSSIAYQFHLSGEQYLKVGAGITAGIAYTGPYPVLSYELRFD